MQLLVDILQSIAIIGIGRAVCRLANAIEKMHR